MADNPNDSLLNGLPSIITARQFSEQQLIEMRKVASAGSYDDILLGTYGSYARREASAQSDLDFFTICRSSKDIARAKEMLAQTGPQLTKIAGRPPSAGGAFGEVEDLDTMLSNIGGNDDHNSKITRRILFLLEGEWLNNEGFLSEARNELLARYVRNSITSHQLALFLLNDVIRYYRTICVDFEFKTIEDESPKPWGTRNIKLVFSRKLLYFSGILAVAETAQRSYAEKTRVLHELLSMPVIDRVLHICGPRALQALKLYDEFMSALSREEVRRALDTTNEDQRSQEPFRRLKDIGHHFSWKLLAVLRETYDSSHPIHRAIVM